jgi:ABC-type transport system involved in cytochrome bd biosynthesis fused ATPase/permease subunit
MLARIRKAVIAGVTAGAAAAIALLAKSGWSLDQTTVVQALSAFVSAAAVAAWATWRVPNAPTAAPYQPR